MIEVTQKSADRLPRGLPPSCPRSLGGMTRPLIAAIALSLVGLWIVFAIIVRASYEERLHDSSAYGRDVAALLAADLAGTFETYDLSLHALVANLTDPNVAKLPAALRSRMLFDASTNASIFGAMLVIDKRGIVIDDSRHESPPHLDVSDREYFKAQRDSGSAGLLVSHPYKSRVTGEIMVGVSRRVDDHGRFEGVALGTLRFDALLSLFAKVRLPPGSTIALLYPDGGELAGLSVPAVGADVQDRRRPSDSRSWRPEAAWYAAREGVPAPSLSASCKIAGIPLVQRVSIPVSAALATFWRRTLATAAGFLLLSAVIVALGVMLTRELARRTVAESSLRRLATTDALTGLVNRGCFDELLRREFERSLRTRQPLALIMIDVDYFKAFNDTYGHSGGDATLRAVARILADGPVRCSDVVARIGGEEFAILMPDTDVTGADRLAERIQFAVRSKALPHAGSPSGTLTISIGLACHTWAMSAPNPLALFDAADRALYRAKHGGRNMTQWDSSQQVSKDATLAA